MVDATHNAFKLYRDGMIKEAECGQESNHSVLAVGYGYMYGENYVEVKNSWGTGWG